MSYYTNSSGDIYVAVGLKSTSKVLPQVKIYMSSKNRSYSLVHSHLMPFNNILDVTFILKSKYLVSIA